MGKPEKIVMEMHENEILRDNYAPQIQENDDLDCSIGLQNKKPLWELVFINMTFLHVTSLSCVNLFHLGMEVILED